MLQVNQLCCWHYNAGMPKGKKWFLYAPEGDVAILRNYMAYELWRRMGR